MKDYYTQEAEKYLEREKHEAEMLAKAWGEVKRVKTKGGEDFKALAKNFEGATVKAKPYALTNEKEISVTIRDDKGHYFSDTIEISRTVQDKAKAEELGERLIDRGAYLYPIYNLEPAEIEGEIKSRISLYEKRAAELGELLANFEQVAGELVTIRNKAEEIIKEKGGDIGYYALRAIFRGEYINR